MTLKLKFLILLTAVSLSSLTASAESISEEPARNNPLEADMVWIPPGLFLFGTDKQDEAGEALSIGLPKPWYADETPRQKIFLKGFYIDRHETTHRRYKIYVDDLGAMPPSYWENDNFPEGQEDLPVTWATWFDAANFCQWAGKHLPSEKEWERAARGNDGNLYPWGNKFNIEYANLAGKAGGKNALVPVGSYPQGASPEGALDLVGNAWEWTANDYGPYKGSRYQSPYYEESYKTLRGASASYFGHFPGASYTEALKKFARGGYRQPAPPEEGARDVGFRCVSQKQPEAMKIMAAGSRLAQSGSGKLAANALLVSAEAQETGTIAAPSTPFNPFQAKPRLPQSGMLILIFLSFAAGALSFLSPCTLPILPAYFAVTAQAGRARMSLMSIAFFCGLAALFVLMGASASFAGQILRDYMFALTTYGGILVVVFGVMTIMGRGFSGAHFSNKPASTFLGSFLFGATFALGWTPCVGPILSGILIMAASDKSIGQGMALLFSYAVGLGLPLIFISAFCSRLDKNGLFWRALRGKGWEMTVGGRTLLLHSTNLFSGLLLIAMGTALAMGYLTYLNSLIPIEAQIWFSQIEEKILHWFM